MVNNQEFDKDIIHIMCQRSNIRDAVDRVEYISTQERQQEKLIAFVGNNDRDFWQQLALECQRSTKNTKEIKREDGTIYKRRAIEAIEMMVVLPDEFLYWDMRLQIHTLNELKDYVESITGTECLIGLHDSHRIEEAKGKEGNCHVHILMAERPLLPKSEIHIAERNKFYNEEGKHVRTKKEIVDENGKIRDGCYIVPKGEVVRMFDSKYNDMTSVYWRERFKQQMADWINEKFEPDLRRVVYSENSPYIPQIHIGKKVSAEKAEEIDIVNSWIKEWNNDIRTGEFITAEEAFYYKPLIMLAPERAREIINTLKAMHHNEWPDDPEFEYVDKTASIPRTMKPLSKEEKMKQELREHYRLAQVERNAANETTDFYERREHTANARRHSAEIDRLNRALGNWKPERYYQEMRKDEKELAKLQSEIENTKYWIKVYSKKSDDVSICKWRANKKNLQELQLASKALSRQIKQNKDKWKAAGYDLDNLKDMTFDERIASAAVRSTAKRNAFKDYSREPDMLIGPTYTRAQVMLDAIQIREQENVFNTIELEDRIKRAGNSLIRLKFAIETSQAVLNGYEDTRQLIVEYQEIRFVQNILNMPEGPEKRKLLNISYRETQIARYYELKEELAKKGLLSDEEIESFKRRYNRVLNDTAKSKALLKSTEEEYLRLRKVQYANHLVAGGAETDMYSKIDYKLLRGTYEVKIDYEHREAPPERDDWDYER